MTEQTVAQLLMKTLAEAGCPRGFGVPGGGSSLDLIAAGEANHMPFILTRTEAGGIMMAAATAEMTGAPGFALTTKGPGTANGANGVAYASLDRAPTVVATDGFSPAISAYVTHQYFDQKTMYAPVVKGHALLTGDHPGAEITDLLRAAYTPPLGPVHVELTTPAGKRITSDQLDGAALRVNEPGETPEAGAVARATELLARARRPVVVAGVDARSPAAAAATLKLLEKLGCPGFVTYKAKGVIPDNHPLYGGIFTGGVAEKAIIDKADLIVLAGLDPVELILQPWPHAQPVVDLALRDWDPHYTTPEARATGRVGEMIDAVADGLSAGSDWQQTGIAEDRAAMRRRIAFPGNEPLNPQSIVERVWSATGGIPRVTVDAGAHMFSATAFWEVTRPNDILISNGLATMALALPAGIAAALQDPQRGAVALTGDGGLMMCAGELATAVQYNANLLVVVFNDSALSLIDMKQRSRQMDRSGVAFAGTDFAAVARGFGLQAWKADTIAEYNAALDAATATTGPRLIDARFDPSGYAGQLKAMRG
ncbi:MAG: thiamine pyrophosphate-binding protein [Rhodospirillales bacterium]